MNRTLLASLLSIAVWLAAAPTTLAVEDDSNDTPTSWVWYHGQTPTQVTNLIGQGYRIVDIEVESASPLKFTVAMVQNAFSYAKTWWWYYGVDTSTLSSLLSQNQARLIDLEPYDQSGQLRYAAVMVKNTGADAKAWWWVVSTNLNDLSNTASQNQARIVDLEQTAVGSTTWYSAVLIKNTGADAKAWWWWLGVDTAFISNEIATKNLRIIDLERRSDGKYNVVLVGNDEGFYWWWWVGTSESQLNANLAQTGSRLIDVEKVNGLFGPVFYAVAINNSNDLTTRVGEILRNGSDGSSGLYLKQIDSSTLAALQETFVFEPASTLKTLLHVHAMRQVALGNVSLSQPLLVYLDSVGSCPQYGTNTTVEPLETVLKLMMEQSDNNRTMAVRDYFGQSAINATAVALGMTSTQVIHTIGCGGAPPNCNPDPLGPGACQPNRLTLADGYELHRQVANGYLGAQRQKFYDLMLQSVNNFAGGQLSTIIDQEGASLGLPSFVVSAFKANVKMAYKGGSYGYGNPLKFYRSVLAWVEIPFKDGPAIEPREYVAGVFIHGASDDSAAASTLNTASAELLRDIVRLALQTWENTCTTPAQDVAYGQGKPGTNGTPVLAGGLPPVVGKTSSVVVSNGLPGAFPLLFLGSSAASINFDGGTLLVANPLVFPIPVPFNSNGSLTLAGDIPNDAALCGVTIYHQVIFSDPGAAGFYHTAQTNGLARTFGG